MYILTGVKYSMTIWYYDTACQYWGNWEICSEKCVREKNTSLTFKSSKNTFLHQRKNLSLFLVSPVKIDKNQVNWLVWKNNTLEMKKKKNHWIIEFNTLIVFLKGLFSWLILKHNFKSIFLIIIKYNYVEFWFVPLNSKCIITVYWFILIGFRQDWFVPL